MMNEERVLGPLNLKQVIFLGGGLGAVYLLQQTFAPRIALPTALVVMLVAVMFAIRNKPPRIDEAYIAAKRTQCASKEEYLRWLQRKLAEVQSQIDERKRTGFAPDPVLDTAVKMFETYRQKALEE